MYGASCRFLLYLISRRTFAPHLYACLPLIDIQPNQSISYKLYTTYHRPYFEAKILTLTSNAVLVFVRLHKIICLSAVMELEYFQLADLTG